MTDSIVPINREARMNPRWWCTSNGWSVAVLTFCLGSIQAGQQERVDLAAFGERLALSECGVVWQGPIRVAEVRVHGCDNSEVADWCLEWWGSVWPDHGTGGWMRLDDPWNGQWVTIGAKPERAQDGAWTVRIPALARSEWARALEASRYPDSRVPDYRKTLKVRVVGANGGAVPERVRLEVLGDAVWAEGEFDLWHRSNRDGSAMFQIEATHGEIAALTSLSAGAETKPGGWTIRGVAGASGGVRARIRYVESADPAGEERTRVTVRCGSESASTGFSFVPQDVPGDGVIRVADFGFLVARSGLGRTWENDPGSRLNAWRQRVRRRVVQHPEATRESAMAGLPRLSPPRDVPVGVPSARQEFFVSPTGDWSIQALSLNTDGGRDAKRWVFEPEFGRERLTGELRATLDTRGDPAFDGADRVAAERQLEEGHLPLIHVQWRTGPIQFHQQLAATILEGEYGEDDVRRGDETVVLLTQLTVTNVGEQREWATVNLRYNLAWPLRLGSDGVLFSEWPSNRVRPPGLTAVRAQLLEVPAAAPAAGVWDRFAGTDPKHSDTIRWRVELAPGERRTIEVKVPFVELLESREVERLKEIRFATAVPRMLEYWRRRLASRMQLEVPDAALNDFYRANLWHILITTDRDPATGLYNQGVGTVQYRVFANETVMIARYLDAVGESREAERFLEPLLRYQGWEALTGRFSTKEGVFHSAGQYTHGQYAMNHGFVLWGVAEHYLITRDRAYLERAASQLVKGCEFLIRERQATYTKPDEARSPVHGLAPASSLEDVVEFQYWLAANSYFHLGMKRVAEALADIRHPEASRLAREAEAYRQDIEKAAREAATRSAVVRLRDDTWIPYVPSRVGQWRHLTEGWIREALYPALHLVAGEIVSSRDPLIGWMLDDLEDNIFFSWQSGYNVADYEQTWFEHGGVTLQPCLLDLVPTYLSRDEVPAALRSFWNTYALSIYPDVHCFAEWARRFGQGGGPVYKTSDEARFLRWLRDLLLFESDGRLWYGKGIPGKWVENGQTIRLENARTLHGLSSLIVRSDVDHGRIAATVRLPERLGSHEAWLRLRHPHGKCPVRVWVNGREMGPDRVRGCDVRLWPDDGAPIADAREIIAEYGR